ncbi:hypothetical protein CDV50_06630 [Haematobacter massiliensis]|nr:hypothetical protein CDV50_06630 [Haematobacter massiliensis]OWJ85849.1 hypothetical protein CDV51_11515 [Haematobacter massiliensis]
MSSGRLEDLLTLYASDAILVPTMADEVDGHDNNEQRAFRELPCQSQPAQAQQPQAGESGFRQVVYFPFGRVGAEQALPARFLFPCEDIDRVWLITGHHSSRMPSS